MALQSNFKKQATAAVLAISALTMSFPAAADNHTSAKYDYITECISGNCAKTEGSTWSNKHENSISAVGISVRMGMHSSVTDETAKNFFATGLTHHKVQKIKFFFEQNDAPSTGFFFHVRGGTEGPYTVKDDLKTIVKNIAQRANNTNPALASSHDKNYNLN